MESTESRECARCGTCCVAPDISSLQKKPGERCRHLTDALACGIYRDRPAVCRGYRPDEICASIAAPTLDQRVAGYLRLFGLREIS